MKILSFEGFSNFLIKVEQVYIIYINIMFMKLVRLNKIILNIKYINIQWEVAYNNLLISSPYTIWGWTFYFALSNHFLLRMGKHLFPLPNYILFSNQ